jgi:hypothetical protein
LPFDKFALVTTKSLSCLSQYVNPTRNPLILGRKLPVSTRV